MRSSAGHLSAAQVSSITPQGLARLAAPVRHVIAAAFADARPPIYAYLIPLLAVTILFALILKEIPLHPPPGCSTGRPPQARTRSQGTAAASPARLAADPVPPPVAATPSARGRPQRAAGLPAACPLPPE
jgi:hypothetical protein